MTTDAIGGLTDLVEAMHQTVASAGGILDTPGRGRTRGITGLVYASVRAVTGLVGHGVERLLAELAPMLAEESSWPGREALLAALNGVLGDYLAASGNPLAIPMRLRQGGRPLSLPIAHPTGKVVVLVHGLCMNDLQWNRQGHDHGAALAGELGFTSLYLHYNSGRHVSTNGREAAQVLEALVKSWPVPVEELVLVGHSLGGLVCRSACHYGEAAGHEWRKRLSKLVFLGTPHHGAPLERGGNWVDVILELTPYSAPFARLGKIRSAGVTDLRFGNVVDEDWEGRDRFERAKDQRRPVPLPEGVKCYAIAGTNGKKEGDLTDWLVGDGLVPLSSALGRHEEAARTLGFPESRQWIARGVGHQDLLSRPEVYERLKAWLAE
ncbi:MAG: esterase/lipase family protein [Myxococcaceae bacterium]